MGIVRHLSFSMALVLIATLGFGQSGIGPITSSVPRARKRVAHPPTLIAPQFRLQLVVQGSDPLENPSGVITRFGFLNDFPDPEPVEPTKTEPDENSILSLFEGFVLVTAVLLPFLGNVRAAIITAAVIPLSMLISFLGDACLRPQCKPHELGRD
jgi:hypothetical protein